MSILTVFSPQIRDVFAIYILVGLMVIVFQYALKYTWNFIARIVAKIKGEEYRPPPF